VTTTFAPEAGWPHGTARDSDPTLFEKEKALADVHPVRKVKRLNLLPRLGQTRSYLILFHHRPTLPSSS
jgi:hypothetical protein